MATRSNNPVTLTHEQANTTARILGDYATVESEHARRTRSEAVRDICTRNAARAKELSEHIVKHLYSWSA